MQPEQATSEELGVTLKKNSREFLHARGLHNNIIKLGVPLSARKELPDNLGPQNDSQMNDNREGTVDFWGCWGALRCCIGLCVRACVRPQNPYGRRTFVKSFFSESSNRRTVVQLGKRKSAKLGEPAVPSRLKFGALQWKRKCCK